jgi:O-antigen/teichoic acid export membrane protein
MSDRLFLKSFGTDSALINGYSEAYKLLEIAFVVPGLTMPAVASLWKKTVKKEGLQLGKLGQLVGVTVGLGTLSCLGLVILGPLALQLIQKNVYESAYQVLPILALSLIFFFLIIFFKNVLIFFNRERVELMISGVTGVTAVGLYIVLIGKYGVVGAAWSSVLVFAIGAITSSGFVWRTIRQEQKQDRN